MSTSRLTTLGGFAFSSNDVAAQSPATRKARALMAFLIMNRDADTSRERLFEIFWPDADPIRARDSLNTALWSIRRCARTAGMEADQCLLASKSMVRWTTDTAVDAKKFAELVVRDDLAASREALELYRGDFLEGDYDNWAVTERERLAALYETALAHVMRESKDADAAQRFIARNPYNEEAYATLIEAEFAAGRRSSAASWIERCRQALAEVGEKPSNAFEKQFGHLTYVEPALTEELVLPFAGREPEMAALAARFEDAMAGRGSVTVLHGEAGIGKSTLINRATRIATESGLRVLTIDCASEVPTAFGPWPGVFDTLEAGDFDTFIRSHPSDLAAAVAEALITRMPEATAVLVDDAHELSAEALDIFVALTQRAMSRHVVVAGSRPEGVAILRSRLIEVPCEDMAVGRLERTDLSWALAQALGREQSDLLNVLYDRTSGHPLFFTGLLNSLVSSGILARDGRQWRLAKPLGTDIELPSSVKRFIETRLRARGDVARTVACALALEPAATADDITIVLGTDQAAVLDALDDLLALGLITQPTKGPQFAFAHELVREVAAAGLNVGRRTVMHRLFAERLKGSTELEVALRLARHLGAAGEHLAAGQSYLKAAQEALALNAAQDALDRCMAGIEAAEMLEHSPARDVLLARLNSQAAHAAIARGEATDAVQRARDAAALARKSGDLRESIQTTLTLAALEGAACAIHEQRSDALEAQQNARLCGDEALEAEALVQQASAARELGLRDEALHAGQAALTIAINAGKPAIAQSAREELLRAQMSWWLFDDALEMARTGLDPARRSEPLIEAAFQQARSALWYLLERFDEAQSDLENSLRIMSNALARGNAASAAPTHPIPFLQFTCYYLSAKIAVAQKRWEHAIDTVQRAAGLTNIAKLPRHSEALALLIIDALLQRNSPGDAEAAHEKVTSLISSTGDQGTLAWSDCVELARARDASRQRLPDAGQLLRRALNTLERNAQRAPLEADGAFARLAAAAAEIGESAVANHARGRAKYYRTRRVAAAGSAWSMNPLT